MTDKKRDKPTEEIKDEELEKTQGGVGFKFGTASRFNTANRFATAFGIDQIHDSPRKR